MSANSRTLTFRVVICGRLLERRCSWSDVERFKEKVKIFCKWRPREKLWMADVGELLKRPSEALASFREIFGSEGEKCVFELILRDRELRDREVDCGRVLLLPVNDREVLWRLLRTYAQKRSMSIAGESVDYYVLDLKAALEAVIRWGVEPDTSADALLDTLTCLDPNITAKQQEFIRQQAEALRAPDDAFALVDWGARGALVVAPKAASGEIISRLQSALTVDYFRQRLGVDGVELVPHQLRLAKLVSGRVMRVPYIMIPLVAKILSESGFRVIEDIRWPLSPRLEPNPRFSLYAFQEEALNAWKRAGCRGTIVMPTGAGKTFVALAAIAEVKAPTLVCVTTVELAKQWVRRINECLGLRAGILAGGEKRIEPVTVATYHSAVRALPDIYDRFGLIVFDEGHHMPAETFKEIALHAKVKYVMVLSATPERSDRNEVLIYKACGEPVYSTSYYELVIKGLLAPLKVEVLTVQLDADEAAKYAEASEVSEDPKRAAELIRIAACAKAKLEALKNIIITEKGKILAFCQFVDQAEKAYEVIKEIEPKSALVTGSTPKGERLRAFEGFRRGSIRVLVTTSVLDEGIDVPDADVAVILSGTGQVRQMIQRVGRVLRWAPGKVAKVYEIIASGTIEEALSKSRSIFKVLNRAEVEAALRVALAAYERMRDAESKFNLVSYAERERMVEEMRAAYVKLAAELALRRSLLSHQ